MKTNEHLVKIALPSAIGMAIGERIFGKPWKLYRWLAYIEQRVVAALNDPSREHFFIINAPPQTGKSSYVGELLPFWITGMFPEKRLIYISYSDDFSVGKGKKVKAMHEQYADMFGYGIDPDFSSGSDWRIKGHYGGMLSVGIGGQITGMPGDVVIVDDLIKGAEEARSSVVKKAHLAEWDGTISTRIQPGAVVIVMATRWAEDDLSGSLLERMRQPEYEGPQWEVLSFPAYAQLPDDLEGELSPEERAAWTDIIGRLEGEYLECRFTDLPGREHPDDWFRMQRAIRDPFAWSCLYQQSPFSVEGSMFPRNAWKFYSRDELPEMEEQWRIWDLASTAGGGDWTVGTKIGRHNDRLYVLDVQRFRKAADDVLDAVKDRAQVDGFYTAIGVEEEKGGAGKTTIAAIKKQLPRHRVEPMKAEGDKVSRATPWSAEQRGGRAYLPYPEEADWDVKEFIDEHAKMMQDGRLPRHDDQIDTAAYGAAQLIGGETVEVWTPGSGSDLLSPEAQMRLLDGMLTERGVSISVV